MLGAKERESIHGQKEFDVFLDLSKKIDLYAGRKGVEDFYRVTRMVGEAEIQLKVRIVGRYLKQGEYLEGLDPGLLDPFFVAIENLGKNHQNIVRLLKAAGRLFERPIMRQDLGKERKEAAHFLYSVNNFAKNNFPEEDLNDLFTRVPLEGSDHNWLGNLYAQRGLHEYALDEIRLAESKEESLDARIERFSPELLIKEISRKEGEKRSAGKRKSTSIKIEALNPRSGKYEALQAKITRGKGDYVIVPPKLSSDYFDRDGNVKLRFLEGEHSRKTLNSKH